MEQSDWTWMITPVRAISTLPNLSLNTFWSYRTIGFRTVLNKGAMPLTGVPRLQKDLEDVICLVLETCGCWTKTQPFLEVLWHLKTKEPLGFLYQSTIMCQLCKESELNGSFFCGFAVFLYFVCLNNCLLFLGHLIRTEGLREVAAEVLCCLFPKVPLAGKVIGWGDQICPSTSLQYT